MWKIQRFFKTCRIVPHNLLIVKCMKVILTIILFSRWPTCLHESYFNNGLIFQVIYPFMKYMKVISTLNIGLIIMGDLPHYEIHESDFNNCLIFQVTYVFAWKWFQQWSYFPGDLPIYEIHESDFNIEHWSYYNGWSPPLWNIWKWFQQWSYFSSDLLVREKNMKVFQHWSRCNVWPTQLWKNKDFSSGLIIVDDLPRWKIQILFMIGLIFPSDLLFVKTWKFF